MKHIVKSEEPQVLLDFKNNYKKKHGRNAIYNDMTPIVKSSLKSALSEEQHFICCYCMKRIKQHNSHIEHIKPQAHFPDEALRYYNLLVSCNGMEDNNENCGHKKDDWYNVREFLTPLDPNCEKIFTYNAAGRMDASQKNGKVTITKLNLNSLLLVRARKAVIKLSGLFDDDFEQKKQELIAYNTTPNSDNKLPPFCMAVIYCINNYG